MTSADESTPIAVVGLGCRFPGGASSGEKFWELLMSKKSARTDTPANRFNADAFYHPNGEKGGCMNVRAGHFIEEDISAFDAPFFSISPAEAVSMDPMQRMLLEVVYEAMENAGIPLSRFAESNTGCYVGCFSNDYDQICNKDPETLPKYNSVGTGPSILSNRISFCFNLRGPSVTVDTACSSSLVALHMACQSLLTGETKAAIVGASQATLFPDMMVAMTKLHFLSPDGVSHSFDSRANGYARGEGMAAVVLKPLSEAMKDGDTIRAVIRGTAVNSNGRGTGITLPVGSAQARLIRTAYEQAGLDLAMTNYIEAHGTGTPAGDPIESGAIGETFGAVRPEGEGGKLLMGSVKSNIGHLEGASGLAGLIKTILILEKGVIAPNVWFDQGNKKIDFDGWRLRVPVDATPWPTEGLRRASVNSFGYGGTNGHVILDDAYHYMLARGLRGKHNTSLSRGEEPLGSDTSLTSSEAGSGNSTPPSTSDNDSSDNDARAEQPKSLPHHRGRRPQIFFVAGHEAASVTGNAKLLSQYVASKDPQDEATLLSSLAQTLGERRSLLDVGGFAVASSKDELVRELDDLSLTYSRRTETPSLAFVFTGQGAQWFAMGRELLAYPVFEGAINACDAAVASFGSSWSLTEELLKGQKESRINDAEISQPLCTALQIALVDLFASWSVHPERVVGHSSGEIAAAYATGALDLESAMRVAYFRGLLTPMIKTLGLKGGMLAAGLSGAEAEAEIQAMGEESGKISVACVNSPKSVTLSGDIEAVSAMQKILIKKQVFVRKLQVETAYHSHHMQRVADEYLQSLRGLKTHSPKGQRRVAMFSSVKSKAIVSHDELGAEYWVSNMVSSVQFSDALGELCNDETSEKPVDVLIELGPHSALAGPVKQVLAELKKRDPPIQYLSALVRERTDPKGAAATSLTVAAALYALGYPADLHTANFSTPLSDCNLPALVDLPTYSWNRSRKYWHESRLSKAYRFREFPRSDLLGAPVNDWNPFQPRWRNFIRLSEQPWVSGHTIQGAVAYPAAGFCCMAIEAIAQLQILDARAKRERGESSKNVDEYKLTNVEITQALLVPEAESGVEVSLSLTPSDPSDLSSPSEFRVFSYTEESDWSEHCRGHVQVVYQDDGQTVAKRDEEYKVAYSNVSAACRSVMDKTQVYEKLKSVGLGYGPDFQGMKTILGGHNQVAGVVEVTDTAATMPFGFEHGRLIHPATMDALLQISLVATANGDAKKIVKSYVPTWIEELGVAADIHAPIGHELEVFASSQTHGPRGLLCDIKALTGGSKAAARMSGVKLVTLGSSSDASTDEVKKITATAVWDADVDLISAPKMNDTLAAAITSFYDYEKLRDRELLGYYYLDQVLQSIDEAREYDGMLPHHQKFYRYMQHQRSMVQSGTHEFMTPDWTALGEAHVHEKIESIKDALSKSDAEGTMFLRMGPALTSVLRQEVEPLALMMQDSLLFDYYHCAPGSHGTYPKATRYFELLSHKYPDLEYLEIGAGTGGLTRPALEGLGRGGNRKYPRCKSYTYTDISTGFFEQAAEKFIESADVLDFKKLDIEQDPRSQPGFEGDKLFDVIVAANVLHATTNMQRTMSNVRKLLRPGGKLVLLEVTHATIGLSMIFGNLPGWWASDEEWRVNGPLLSASQWSDICRETGFSDLEVCAPDTTDPLLHQADVMVLTALPEDAQSNGVSPRNADALAIKPASPLEDGDAETFDNFVLNVSTKLNISIDCCTLEEARTRSFSGLPVISFVELNEAILPQISVEDLATVQRVVGESAGLIWVTRGDIAFQATRPEMAVAQGMLRSIRHENEHLPIVSLDLSAAHPLSSSEAADLITSVYEQNFGHETRLQLGKPDAELCEHDGAVYIKRAIENPRLDQLVAAKAYSAPLAPELQDVSIIDRPLKLSLDADGSGSMVFDQDTTVTSEPLREDHVQIKVHAIGLSLRDALVCAGMQVDDHVGNECAGVVTHVGSSVQNVAVGDRVVAWTLGTYATVVRAHHGLVHKIPTEVSFAKAASIPDAYIKAYYSLIKVANIQQTESVLIQNADSVTGQAAIQVATKVGCQVLAGGTDDLEHAVRDATSGRGVSVLLLNGVNTETSELKSMIRAVAPFGRVVQLGGQSVAQPAPSALRNVAWTTVDIVDILNYSTELASTVLSETMAFALSGDMKIPEPVVDPLSKMAESMQKLRSSDLEEVKTVFEPQASDLVHVVPNQLETIQLRQDGSYLLIGGFGGLGRSLALWMVEHGAKNLIFVSRRGALSTKASELVSQLEAQSVTVGILVCDVSNEEKFSEGLGELLSTMPPVRGVVNSAMDLQDSVFVNMSQDMFLNGLKPKVQGSWTLHKATLDQPLDFFIMLSSAAAFFGSIAQANYVAACTYQVALAAYRRALGLPAVSLDVSKIVDVGYVAEDETGASNRNLTQLGMVEVRPEELLCLIEMAMQPTSADVNKNIPNGHLLTGVHSTNDATKGEDLPFWSRDPVFSHMDFVRPHVFKSQKGAEDASALKRPLEESLKTATSSEEAESYLSEGLLQKLARALMMKVEDLDPKKAMSAYGVDSLVAVDLRNWLARSAGVDMPVFEILRPVSLSTLVQQAVTKSSFVKV